MPSQTVSHYELLERLGQGGMGTVYKARDVRLSRLVALKFLSRDLVDSPEARARFLREGQALSSLSHPHIATVYEVDEADGTPFLALEFLPGGTLRSRIRDAAAYLNMSDVIEWGIGLARGLAHAHGRGVVHRDVKASNAMFDAEGRIKLTDFGLAKVTSGEQTSGGSLVGTVSYMSPEQVAGKRVDHRSDLFSLGILLYEAATGRLPFAGEAAGEIVYRILNDRPTPPSELRPDLPEKFETVVDRLLAKAVEGRYQSAGDVARDLRYLRSAYRDAGAMDSTQSVVALRPARRVRRRWLLAAAGPLVALAIAGAFAGRRWYRSLSLPKQKHLAVLPLRSIGGDAGQQAFCDGLTETITTALSKHGQLSVVPATESRRIESAEQARKEFGVNLVVYGTVQRRGDQVRLILSLIDAERQRQIDAEPIDWPVARLWELEDAVLAKLADLLNLILAQGQENRLAASASRIPAAHDAYLRGRGFLYRYERQGNFDRALREFEEAARRDPRFALAYIGVAETHLRVYRARKEPEILRAARAAAERAVALNPNLAGTRRALGAILAEAVEPEAAARELEMALRLDPRDPAVCRELANLYRSQQRFGEAEQVLQKAIAARPGDWISYTDLGTFYFGQHRYDEAERAYRKVKELVPDNHLGYRNLGVTLVRLGRNREAETELRRSVALRPAAIGYSNLGALLMFDGRYQEAVEVMEKAAHLAPQETPNNFRLWGNLGDAHWLARNNLDQARTAWRRAAETAARQLTGTPADAELLSYLAKYQAKAGDEKAAAQQIQAALNYAPDNAMVRYQAGLIYALLGQKERALSELAAALDHGYSASEIQTAPELGMIRTDPNYQQLIQRRGRH